MTTTQTPTDLLLSLAAQVADAKTETEMMDLYLLARGVFYSALDALDGATFDAPYSTRVEDEVRDLRSAWNDVAFACSARNETKRSTAYGLVTFSDGSSYGGRQS